jgi:hypothetical protein
MMATVEIPVPVTGTTGFLNRNLIAALFLDKSSHHNGGVFYETYR